MCVYDRCGFEDLTDFVMCRKSESYGFNEINFFILYHFLCRRTDTHTHEGKVIKLSRTKKLFQ